MVTINNNINDHEIKKQRKIQFKISSPIPRSIGICFSWLVCSGGITLVCIIQNRWGPFYVFFEENHERNMAQLDYLTDYLYTNSDYSFIRANGERSVKIIPPSPDMLASYRENIKTKMIQSFINKGISDFMRVVNNILPKELILVIIDMFMKLDNWHNLGFSINFYSG